MKITVTRSFQAVRPGKVYPSTFVVGTVVTGRLAEIALEMKCGTHVETEPVEAETVKTTTVAPTAPVVPPHADNDTATDAPTATVAETPTATGTLTTPATTTAAPPVTAPSAAPAAASVPPTQPAVTVDVSRSAPTPTVAAKPTKKKSAT